MKKKNSFLGISLIALFLMAIGTKEAFCQEGTTDYYAVSKTTWAIPERIDESELTNLDREELSEYEDEYDECDESIMLYLENFSWLIGMDKENLKIWMPALFDEDVTISERDGFVIATYEDEEDGYSMEMAINPNTLIYEERYFGVEDNPFFEETGNKLAGLYRVTFKKTTGVNQDIVPIKETNLWYGMLESGMPYEITNEFTYFYYKHINDYDRTITTGDVELFNDCMGYTGLKEIQQANLRIYPNPAKEQLTIEYGSSACFGYAQQPTLTAQERSLSEVEVEIYNVVGQNVGANLRVRPENNETTIDISHLANGMYFLKVQTDNGMIMKKFVKQ